MYLKAIRLVNLRSFVDERVRFNVPGNIHSNNLNLIVGPNASGKSTVAEVSAISAMRMMDTGAKGLLVDPHPLIRIGKTEAQIYTIWQTKFFEDPIRVNFRVYNEHRDEDGYCEFFGNYFMENFNYAGSSIQDESWPDPIVVGKRGPVTIYGKHLTETDCFKWMFVSHPEGTLPEVQRILDKVVPPWLRLGSFPLHDNALFEREGQIIPLPMVSSDGGAGSYLNIISNLLYVLVAVRMKMPEYHGKRLLEIPAVMIIDRFDDNLDDQGQQELLPILTSVFRRVQFIVTADSMQVAKSVPSESVVKLRPRTVDGTTEVQQPKQFHAGSL